MEAAVNSKGIRSFEELDVYQLSYKASLEIHRATLQFPQIEQYALANQLRRSTKSICANIAEGFAKQRASKTEFRRFLLMALGSANETMVWLDYCRDMGYIEATQAKTWRTEYDSICRMLNAFISRLST